MNELVEGLRKAADFIEQSDLGYIGGVTILKSCGTPIEFRDTIKKLGSFEKRPDSSYMNVIKKFSEAVKLEVYIPREQTCVRVKTGERIIPAQSEKIIPAQPEKKEEVYEWKCPESLLGLAE